MKENKGFTLAELLAVIIILGIITTITVPIVTNQIDKNKTKLCVTQYNNILNAARSYGADHLLELDNGKTITLKTLDDNGYIDISNLKDPVTGEKISGDLKIVIVKENKKYKYYLDQNANIGCKEELNSNGTSSGDDNKVEVYADGTKVGVTEDGKKCEIGTTNCYTGYTYGDTKGATKLNLVIGYDANVTGSRNMKVSDLYTIVGLSVPYCNYDYFSTFPGAINGSCHVSGYNEKSCSDTCLVDNVIPEGYEWLYDFDYCENKTYLFRFDETWDYNPSGPNYSVNSTSGWILDKNKNKIVSSLISETVCTPDGCETNSGYIKACKMPKVVTVDKSKFI